MATSGITHAKGTAALPSNRNEVQSPDDNMTACTCATPHLSTAGKYGPPATAKSPWCWPGFRLNLQDRYNEGIARTYFFPMKRFSLVFIKPTHYDDDGYPIQWFRSAIPSNTLAVMNGLALDCKARKVLGEEVDIEITLIDETNTRVQPHAIARQMRGHKGLVALVGVQSNQYPRTMDIARPLRAAGIEVCIGGFHVSGTLSMLHEPTPELTEAMNLGISLFAGEAEGRLEAVLRDAWDGTLRPLYNYMDDLPALNGATLPMLPVSRVERTGGSLTSFDAGRGCPFQCSFCTIINVQGRKSRRRTADDVEQIVRQNLAQGIRRFFITDDNFARNTDWESIFDRIIAMREQEKLDIKFVIQVDTMCHRIRGFIEKAGRAGVEIGRAH